MIGIVICGHGEFPKGVYSATKMIAGEQENLEIVCFTEEMGHEELKVKLLEKIKVVDSGDGVAVFTDIPGGTPFNQAALISSQDESVNLIGGTNLPSLLEALFKRNLELDEFIKEAVISGNCGIKTFTLKKSHTKDEL